MSYKDLRKSYFDIKNKPTQIVYAEAYLKKAQNENKPMQIARAYYMFSIMNKENKAISYLDSVIKYSKNENDPFFPVSAFCEKAIIYKKLCKFKEAMNCYLVAEKYAIDKNKNEDHNAIRLNIGVLKSEYLGEVNEAMIMYKQCLQFYKDKDIKSPENSNSYQKVLFTIADAYKAIHQTDSATYYNKLGYKEANATNNEGKKYLFILNEGATQILKKNYSVAIDSVKKALPKMIEFNSEMNTLASYFYLGKAYEGLNKKDLAVKNFIKVDSIYKKLNYITPEFIGGYQFLINYYKNNGNKEKQLEYLNTFISIDNLLHKNYRQMYKLVKEKYEIPHLIEGKEELISSLKNQKKYSFWALFTLFFITIGFCIFGLYQYRLRRIHRERFEALMLNSELVANNELVETTVQEYPNKKDLGIAKETIDMILSKLKEFEKNKGFLKSNITSQSLSQDFDTNSTYLSIVINHYYMHKNFSQYINDLRIEYSLIRFKEDKDLQKYTISALANEFGFNSAESFSSAFFKKTGIKPSFFIKEIEKKYQLNT